MVGILERFNIIKPIPKKVKPICKALYIIELELKGKVEKKVIESLVLKLCNTATKYYMRNRDYLISISHEKEVNLAMKDLLDMVCLLDETSNPINIPILVNEPDPPHPFDTPIVGKEPIPKTTCTALEANEDMLDNIKEIPQTDYTLESTILVPAPPPSQLNLNPTIVTYNSKTSSIKISKVDKSSKIKSAKTNLPEPLDKDNDCISWDMVETAGPSPKKAKTTVQKHSKTPKKAKNPLPHQLHLSKTNPSFLRPYEIRS